MMKYMAGTLPLLLILTGSVVHAKELPDIRTVPQDLTTPRMTKEEPAAGKRVRQVASEYNWTTEEFIAQTCRKAGLPFDAWTMDGFSLKSFRAEVFTETAPDGDVTRKAPGD